MRCSRAGDIVMATVIDDYLADLSPTQREGLARLRALLHDAIPGAEETIKTRVPALRYNGKTVVGFGATAKHLALYVMFGDALRALKADLKDFDATNRVIRFSSAAPLPPALVRKIVRYRLAEIDAQAKKADARTAKRSSKTKRGTA
jgi:uncharacterized protein YdhG (YjbR/CyaY superfamily)